MTTNNRFEQEVLNYRCDDPKKIFGTLKFLKNLKITEIAISYQAKKQFSSFKKYLEDNIEILSNFPDYYDYDKNRNDFKKDPFCQITKRGQGNVNMAIIDIIQNAEDSVCKFCEKANYPSERMKQKIGQIPFGYFMLRDARELVEKNLKLYLYDEPMTIVYHNEDEYEEAINKKKALYLNFLYSAAYYEIIISEEWKRRIQSSKKLRERMENNMVVRPTLSPDDIDIEDLADITANLVGSTYEETYTLYLIIETLNHKCILQFVELIEYLNLNYMWSKENAINKDVYLDEDDEPDEEEIEEQEDSSEEESKKENKSKEETFYEKEIRRKNEIVKISVNSFIHNIEKEKHIQFSFPVEKDKNRKYYYQYLDKYVSEASSIINRIKKNENKGYSEPHFTVSYLKEFYNDLIMERKDAISVKCHIRLILKMADSLGWNYSKYDPEHDRILDELKRFRKEYNLDID